MSGLCDEKVQASYGSAGWEELGMRPKWFLKAKKCESKQWYIFNMDIITLM